MGCGSYEKLRKHAQGDRCEVHRAARWGEVLGGGSEPLPATTYGVWGSV